MARLMLAACLAAMVAVAAGCKTQKKDVTFIPPEVTASVQDPAEPGMSFTSDEGTGPEPVVGPSYEGDYSAAPGAADEAFRTDPFDTETPTTLVPPDREGEYVVRKGDTLYALARRFYNDHRKWRVIYNANKTTLGNPNLIKVGQVLSIPPVD